MKTLVSNEALQRCASLLAYFVSWRAPSHRFLLSIGFEFFGGIKNTYQLEAAAERRHWEANSSSAPLLIQVYGGSSHGANLTDLEWDRWNERFYSLLPLAEGARAKHVSLGGRGDFHVVATPWLCNGVRLRKRDLLRLAREAALVATQELNAERLKAGQVPIGEITVQGFAYYPTPHGLEKKPIKKITLTNESTAPTHEVKAPEAPAPVTEHTPAQASPTPEVAAEAIAEPIAPPPPAAETVRRPNLLTLEEIQEFYRATRRVHAHHLAWTQQADWATAARSDQERAEADAQIATLASQRRTAAADLEHAIGNPDEAFRATLLVELVTFLGIVITDAKAFRAREDSCAKEAELVRQEHARAAILERQHQALRQFAERAARTNRLRSEKRRDAHQRWMESLRVRVDAELATLQRLKDEGRGDLPLSKALALSFRQLNALFKAATELHACEQEHDRAAALERQHFVLFQFAQRSAKTRRVRSQKRREAHKRWLDKLREHLEANTATRHQLEHEGRSQDPLAQALRRSRASLCDLIAVASAFQTLEQEWLEASHHKQKEITKDL